MLIPAIIIGVCFVLAILFGLLFVLSPFSKDLAAFRAEMKILAERTGSVSEEANNLAAAINGQSRVSGVWAEVGLKRVLDLGGLTENIDYTYQETFASEDSLRKDLRTDILVKMPQNRWIVVDSKNTIKSYTSYVAAEGMDKEILRKDIVVSVKNHVDELKSVQYEKNIRRAFDATLMYIPFEEVYLIAMKAEIKVGGETKLLRDYALENKVLFVNATSLIAILKAVEMSWQQQDADEKAKKIISECGRLCDKLANFSKSYQDLGKSLATLVKSYNAGLGQLATGPGNVLKRVQDLSAYGVPEAKELPDGESLQENAEKIAAVRE